MQNTKQINFKEWLIYKADTSDFQKLYFLFTAVEKISSNEYCSCQRSETDGEVSYHVKCQNVESSLLLKSDEERQDFLNYLGEHYIPEQDIDEWYETKVHQKNKQEKFGTLYKENGNRSVAENKIEIRPHRKETGYFNIKLVITVFAYSALLFYVILELMEGWANVFALLTIVPFIFLLFILRRFFAGIMVGSIKGNALRITEEQFPEVYVIIQEQAKKLGLKEAPASYILDGRFNAFVTKLARNHVLLLYSDVVETFQKGDDRILRFVVGHELGHIKRKHLSKGAWLFPSFIVPFLGLAYSRGCEYTCDRIGYSFSPQGSVEGILTMSVGKHLYSRVSPEKYIEHTENERSFWMWLSEKFQAHPHTAKRLVAINEYSQFAN